MHMPLGKPDATQWHSAATLNEPQKSGWLEEVAEGQANCAEKQPIENKYKKVVNTILVIIKNPLKKKLTSLYNINLIAV